MDEVAIKSRLEFNLGKSYKEVDGFQLCTGWIFSQDVGYWLVSVS